MKSLGQLFGLLFIPFLLSAQLRWDGEAGDGLWSSPDNWVGNLAPTLMDDVLLDNAFVAIDYTISLPPGNISIAVNTLAIRPAINRHITLVNPTTNTSPTAFRALGPGDAVILDPGATFRNSSGASSGTPVGVAASNFFRINTGGRYIHNTERGHTTDLVSRLSTVAGTEEGIFEFDVPSTSAYTISASGRTYGTLRFTAKAAGATKTYTAAGVSPFTINGNLEIDNQATLSYGANTNFISVAKQLIILPGGILNLSNGPNNALLFLKGNLDNQGLITETGSSPDSRIEFSGSSTQDVRCTGSLGQSVGVSINNEQGISLSSNFLLPHSLLFIKGHIYSTASNLLIMANNSIYSGASSNSMVQGPMMKIGDDDFDFPVGQGSLFAPIGITGNGGDPSDAFMAEYIRANPQSTPGLGGACGLPIDHVSYVEYWNLLQTSGSSSKTVKLTVSEGSFAKSAASLLVGSFTGSQWNSLGAANFLPGAAAPPYITGSFTTQGPSSSFGAYTIASSEDELINPLPIRDVAFSIHPMDGRKCILEWTAPCCEDIIGYTIQRAESDGAFRIIGRVSAVPGTRAYQFIDELTGRRINSYRLLCQRADGSVLLSAIRIIDQSKSGGLRLQVGTITGRFPGWLKIYSDGAFPVDLMITDMLGRIIMHRRSMLQPGVNLLALDLSRPAKGNYILAVMKSGRIVATQVLVYR